MKSFDAYSLDILNDAEFAIVNEPEDSTDGTYFHCLKYSELESESDKEKFDALAKEIGIDIPENLGLVKFDGYVVKWFSSPVVAKETVNDKEVVNLIWGVDRKADNLEAIRIPVEFDKAVAKIGKGTFTLDRYEREQLGENGQKTKISIPILNFDIGDEIGFIEIKTDKDSFAWGKFQRFMASGKYDKAIEMIGTIQSGEFANIGKLFMPHFVAKTFPKSGYVIPIIDAEIKPSDYGAQAWLKIDPSGIPGYSVNFSGDLVPTAAVTKITLSNTHTGFRNVVKYLNDGKPSVSKPWFIWIKGRGKQDDTVPVHLITNKLLAPLQAAKDAQPMLSPSSASEADPEALEPAYEVEAVEVTNETF